MKIWYSEEALARGLAAFLNGIEKNGGTVFAVLDGPISRKDYVVVVWYRAAPAAAPTDREPTRENPNRPRVLKA